LRDELTAEGLGADVAGYRNGLSPGCLDQLYYLMCVGLFDWKKIDCYVCAFPREGDGRRAANTGIASGDQRFAAYQPARTLVALLAVIGPWIHLAGESRRLLRLFMEGRMRILGHRILLCALRRLLHVRGMSGTILRKRQRAR